MRKTFGLGDVLREALQPLAAKIRFAFVFGSMARAKESSSSDVDVCIVGDASFEESVILLRSAERILGREVNPVAYSETEIREKLRANNPFAREIVRGPKVWLIGDQDELGAMA
ncbi:MAG: nucleotidyltransferase domain-containing protein [Acidobacteriales bacterium]|nr:nucleotidyltransferase domain-containing protein [Terriglobales bacterium]